jgi:hypothetical protein
MNMHVAVPGTPQDSRALNLAIQERQRRKAISDLLRLRKEAQDQIECLIAFLDSSDEYVQNEREENGDELDASYPNSGCWAFVACHDDDEDSDYDEDDDPAEEAEASGIADMDGILEQIGRQDWQPTGVL